MAICRTEEQKKKLCSRLRRIEGQLRTCEKMLNENAECIDVLRLVNSASGALKGLWTTLLTDHLHHCITHAMSQKDYKLVDELAEHFKNLK